MGRKKLTQNEKKSMAQNHWSVGDLRNAQRQEAATAQAAGLIAGLVIIPLLFKLIPFLFKLIIVFPFKLIVFPFKSRVVRILIGLFLIGLSAVVTQEPAKGNENMIAAAIVCGVGLLLLLWRKKPNAEALVKKAKQYSTKGNQEAAAQCLLRATAIEYRKDKERASLCRRTKPKDFIKEFSEEYWQNLPNLDTEEILKQCMWTVTLITAE